jgi:hypothetical protein
VYLQKWKTDFPVMLPFSCRINYMYFYHSNCLIISFHISFKFVTGIFVWSLSKKLECITHYCWYLKKKKKIVLLNSCK